MWIKHQFLFNLDLFWITILFNSNLHGTPTTQNITNLVCHFILFAQFKELCYLNFQPEGTRAEDWAAESLSAAAFCSA